MGEASFGPPQLSIPSHCAAGHALTATNTSVVKNAACKAGWKWECRTCMALTVTRRQTGFHIEPNEKQRDNARAARDAVNAYGWSITFFPHRPYGERVALRDPGNKGRLGPEARQKFQYYKQFIEVLMERGYALQKTKIKRGNGFVETDATTFASRAMELFPGSRICFE